MSSEVNFHQLVLYLAHARRLEDQLKAKYADELAEVKQAVKVANELEGELRELTRQHFAETGDKQPHEAISVRIRTSRYYPEDANVEKAIEHNRSLLTLDFKRLKELHEAGEADWAVQRETEVATPYISAKLGEYLIAEEITEIPI
jgi:hypothetical protein